MELMFLYLLVGAVGFYVFRYGWVHIQCSRAIGYADYLSKSHIMNCAEAFGKVSDSHIYEEQKAVLRAEITKALNKAPTLYWDEYYKDFDFNKLWMACDQWTLKQMFPNLTNMKAIEVSYE
jgi:hypothetical protein